ncbi:uncharacterized protein LOC106882099 [Octopus bimaculoides]|uniref:uncharacterized protein LOC106882099 n=1 Tax=Octopus bimaculoides TaxID=37653 RepID=UPI00071CDB5C|nr:uncharacterized protein LOC106882099 [Octopus bimaculoides]|eukprot:XP_014788142.1 PREDICTED: uncharacterized protein LOC106882099 [Octopus bimaculoides]
MTNVPGRVNKSRLLYIHDRTSRTRFLMDTGAESSILPVSLTSGHRKQTPTFLQAVNQSPIQTFGKQSLTLNLGVRRVFQWIFVVAKLPTPIIAADFLHHFGLLVDVKRRRLVDSTTNLTVHSITARIPTVGSIVLSPHTGRYLDVLRQSPDITRPVFRNTEIKHGIMHHIKITGPPVALRPRRLPPDR